MALTNILEPPIDASVEFETVTFDFGPILAAGVTLTGTPTLTSVVYTQETERGVTDANPSARLTGPPQFGPSPSDPAKLNAAVLQLFGGCVAGVVYRIQCVCGTTDGQTLSLYTHLSSQAPN